MKRSHLIRLALISLLILASPIPTHAAQTPEETILTISGESEHINIYQSTGLLVSLTNRAGEPLVGQEVTYRTDLGTVVPERAITDVHGEVWVTFKASGQTGASHIIASSNGENVMFIVHVTVGAWQWAVLFVCLLGLFSAVVLIQRRKKKAKPKEG